MARPQAISASHTPLLLLVEVHHQRVSTIRSINLVVKRTCQVQHTYSVLKCQNFQKVLWDVLTVHMPLRPPFSQRRSRVCVPGVLCNWSWHQCLITKDFVMHLVSTKTLTFYLKLWPPDLSPGILLAGRSSVAGPNISMIAPQPTLRSVSSRHQPSMIRAGRSFGGSEQPTVSELACGFAH